MTCPFRWRWEKEERASLREPEESAPVSSKASRIWFICTFADQGSASGCAHIHENQQPHLLHALERLQQQHCGWPLAWPFT